MTTQEGVGEGYCQGEDNMIMQLVGGWSVLLVGYKLFFKYKYIVCYGTATLYPQPYALTCPLLPQASLNPLRTAPYA